MSVRLPAEWERQDAVLLAWPSQRDIWEPELAIEEVQRVHLDLVRAISRFEAVILLVHDEQEVRQILSAAGIDMARVSLAEMPTNDIWIRDFGPITVLADGARRLLDFGYNGWGLKFPSDQDNQASRRLHAAGYLGESPLETLGLILEGGSLDVDEHGALLTTRECLLSPNRNPQLTEAQIEAELKQHLGVQRVIWLDHGWLEGDDTDSHVDVLARFAPGGHILYSSCSDSADNHAEPLAALAAELARLPGYQLSALPIPPPIYGEDGRRLPASYANFLIINGAVLAPAYGAAEADAAALATIGEIFSGYEIIGIDCRPLIYQHGSLHCATMQLPAMP